jgi:hypothetical protein
MRGGCGCLPHTPVGFARLRGHELVAPQLMLIEASSVLHEMAWHLALAWGKPRGGDGMTQLRRAD